MLGISPWRVNVGRLHQVKEKAPENAGAFLQRSNLDQYFATTGPVQLKRYTIEVEIV